MISFPPAQAGAVYWGYSIQEKSAFVKGEGEGMVDTVRGEGARWKKDCEKILAFRLDERRRNQYSREENSAPPEGGTKRQERRMESMPEEPEAVETQTSETEAPPPESPGPNSSGPEAGQESGQEAAAPEEDGDENPPKERRSILLTVLYALVVLLIIAEGLVVCAWWSAVSRAQTEEARQAAWEADRSNLSGASYFNSQGSYRPNDWPEASAVYAGGSTGRGGGSGQGQVVDSEEPTELTGPVPDLEPEEGG